MNYDRLCTQLLLGEQYVSGFAQTKIAEEHSNRIVD